MTRTPLLALAAVAAFALAPAARAQTVAETNAGQTLGTAQNATATAVTRITGSIAPTADDADLYELYISSPATFSATTVNAVTDASGVDTELFLFDSTGHPVAANDDDPARSAFADGTDSTLAVGDSFYKSLPAGVYYLGISSSGNEPVNGSASPGSPPSNQLLFATSTDAKGVRGPASGLNPTTLSNFNSNEYDTSTVGAYEIDLTGVGGTPAAAPEPSAFVALVIGALGLGALRLKARRPA